MAASACAFTGDRGTAKVAAHDMFQILGRQSRIDGFNPMVDTPNPKIEDLVGVGRTEFKDVEVDFSAQPCRY